VDPLDPDHPEYRQLPHIGVESIESGQGRLDEYRNVEDDEISSKNYLFHPNMILYSKIRPNLRKAALVDFSGLCSADIYPLSVISNEILPRFLMWSLLAPPFTKYAKSRSKTRAHIPKINQGELLSYETPFPGRDEQQYIVNYIDSVQNQVDTMRVKLRADEEILKQMERGILQRAFRGEL
jgi:type I restriction enzyme, S subunit